MTEAIPGVNVQALTAFFSKHFEPLKVNTQPRQKFQKNKAFSKLLEFSSKPDLTTCKTCEPSSFSRSLSTFNISTAGILPNFAKNSDISSERKQRLDQTALTSLPNAPISLNSGVCTSANSCQDINYTLDTTSNDSGVEENSESSLSGDSRQSDKYDSHCMRNFSVLNRNKPVWKNSETTSQRSPSVNVVIKNSSLENKNHIQSDLINNNRKNVMTTVWNRTYEVDVNTEIEKNVISKLPSDKVFYSEIVISDNYICKAQYKKTELPSPELLGPPPCKPKKLDNIRLLSVFPTSEDEPFRKQTILSRVEIGKPERETCSPETQHINELRANSALSKTSFAQDILFTKYRPRTVSDVTWKSQSYQQQKGFCEFAENLCDNRNERIPLPRPPSLPPRRLSCPLQLPEECALNYPEIHNGEELYNDTEIDDGMLYEEVPFPSNNQQQLYVNNAKEMSNKMSKEISRLWQKEQRERARQEKELEKLKKKFGLTGEEVPLDNGYIKNDAKGGRGDLAVKKGEAVLIVRIEDNPVGRLLVQNERGKIGYVALDNLTVDADSVKTVMRERKYSMGNKEGRYSNSSSSGEAIYEDF